MPKVGSKSFPYTKKGKAQARVAIVKRLRKIKSRASGRKHPYDYKD